MVAKSKPLRAKISPLKLDIWPYGANHPKA
jgi:hypothetical protein